MELVGWRWLAGRLAAAVYLDRGHRTRAVARALAPREEAKEEAKEETGAGVGRG